MGDSGPFFSLSDFRPCRSRVSGCRFPFLGAAPGTAVSEVSSSWTKPPPRYTETSLVAELEFGRRRPAVDPCEYAQALGGSSLRAARRPRVRGDAARSAGLRAAVAALPEGHRRGVHGRARDAARRGRFRARGDASAARRFLREAGRGAVRRQGGFVVRAAEAGGGRSSLSAVRGATAVLLERGQLVLACRTCPDPEGLPRKATRSAVKKESSEKVASEQAAADQRLQSRCGSCGGAQRWKVAGGYVHLCAAWSACGGVAFEAGRRARVRRAAARSRPAARRP